MFYNVLMCNFSYEKMKNMCVIVFLCVLCLSSAPLASQTIPNFKLTPLQTRMFPSKPSLCQRLNGVKEIALLVPQNYKASNQMYYIFDNIRYYLEKLGLKVNITPAKYTLNSFYDGYYGTVLASTYDDQIQNVLPVNVLSCSVGTNSVSNDIVIHFMNGGVGYIWTYQMSAKNRSEKFQEQLRATICNSRIYNEKYRIEAGGYMSNWSAAIMRSDISANGCDAIEGIYEGDFYQFGVKRDDVGSYYIINLKDIDFYEWRIGEVKATLIPTASPNVFKAEWRGLRKEIMNQTVTFTGNKMIVHDNETNTTDSFIKMYPDANTLQKNAVSSGSGFFLSNNGYIVTNFHVIENARTIKVTNIGGNSTLKYSAQVIASDKQNDIAILKIIDDSFRLSGNIPYALKVTTPDVGEDCFVLGYPLINTMGTEIKLTNGIISAKTGYKDNLSEMQISAPVQPGNSGGPLFDKNGNVVGIVCAKHAQAENAGYAIKASYLKNLLETLPNSIQIPTINRLKGKSLSQQVSEASKFVCLIIINE